MRGVGRGLVLAIAAAVCAIPVGIVAAQTTRPAGDVVDSADALVRLFEAGLPAAEMITHRFSIEQAAEAYQSFKAGDTGKVIFVRDAD